MKINFFFLKELLLVFCILLTSFSIHACDKTSTAITNVVNNGNGTYTCTFQACMEPGDFTGCTSSLFVQFTGANIISTSTPTLTYLNGIVHTVGAISGLKDSVRWSGTSFCSTTAPSHNECFSISVVLSAMPTSLYTENGHSGCYHTAVIPTFVNLSCSATGGNFYDPGGVSGNYANNLNQITTICPDGAGGIVTVTFPTTVGAINTDGSFSNCNMDNLSIYQGSTATSGNLIGTYCEFSAGPGAIVSTASDGCLTFQFVSDGSTVKSGWAATVSCGCTPPVAPTASNVSGCMGATMSALSATAASGGTLHWYGTNATGGTASSTAPTPSSAATGTFTYYVSQTVGGCEGPRKAITVTINGPAAPTVTTPVNYCQGATAAALTATVSAGGTLNWYGTNATGGTASATAPTPSTSVAGTTIYYVSQTVGSCEGPRAAISVVVSAGTPPSYTKSSTDPTCNGSNNGTIVIAPSTAGTTYTWISGPKVSPIPVANLPTGATDERELKNLAPGTYCVNINAPSPGTTTQTLITETFEDNGVNWTIDNSTGPNQFVINNSYAGASCVTGLGTFTVPVVPNQPAAVTSGPTSKYLHIKATTTTGATCGAGSSTPFPPLCANFDGVTCDQKVTLNTNVVTTGLTNVTVTFYWMGKGDASGNDYGGLEYSTNNGTTWTLAGSKLYNQTTWILATRTNAAWNNQANLKFRIRWINNASSSVDPPICIDQFVVKGDLTVTCSGVAQECFTITDPAAIASPTASNLSACQGATAPVLSATASGGGTLGWYGTSATGGTSSTTIPTVSTATVGTTSYYISQTIGGCESPRKKIDVVINAAPTSPTASNLSACQGATAPVLSATASSGGTLNWYGTNATGGTASATIPTVSTATAGTTSYYVSQTVGGCEGPRKKIDVVITATPTAPTASNLSACQGAAAPVLSATATGGGTLGWYGTNATGGTSSATVPTVSTATAGTTSYYVSQTLGGCESPRKKIDVVINATPVAPTVANTSACSGSTIAQLTASGTGTLNWYGTNATGGTSSTVAPTPTSAIAGTTSYYVSQTVGGCEGPRAQINVTVTALPTLSISATVNPSCTGNDGGFTITAAGGSGAGYTYSINNGVSYNSTVSPTSLAAGTYQVMVKDGAGCISAATPVSLTASTAPSLVISAQSNPTCSSSNGSFTITASGGSGAGYTYSINNGVTYTSTNTPSSLATGTYQVIVKDVSGCTSTATAVVLAPASSPTLVISNTTSTTCNLSNGSFTITASNGSGAGYTYSIDNGVTYSSTSNPTSLAVGTYQVIVKDGAGCVSAANPVTIAASTIPTLSISNNTNPSCAAADGGFTITASAGSGSGYTYSIDNGVTYTAINNPSTLPSGTYQVIVKDGAGCVSTVTPVVLTASSAPTLTVSNQVNPSCGASDGGFTITAASGSGTGYTYSVDNGVSYSSTNVLSNLSAGTYQVVVMDNAGCVSAATPVTLVASGAPSLVISNAANPTCVGNDGSFTITASGGSGSGYAYSLDNGITYSAVSSPTSLLGGTYQVIVKDNAGCVSVATPVTLVATGNPTVAVANQSNPTCAGNDGTITLSASGGSGSGYQYSIDNGLTYAASNVFSNLVAGSYDVLVKDGNACVSASINVILTASNSPVAAILNQTDPTCSIYNGTITLSASAGSGSGYTFSIDNGATYTSTNGFTNLWPGNYTILVKDGNGCISTPISATLTMQGTIAPVIPTISGVGQICPNTTGVTFSSANNVGSTYTWSVPSDCNITLGQGTEQLTVDWGANGGIVTLLEENSCGSASQTFTVNVNNIIPTSPISGTLSVCPFTSGINYNVNNPNSGSTFSWTITGGSIVSGDGTSSVAVDWGDVGNGYISVVEQTICGNLMPDTLLCVISTPPIKPSIQFADDTLCSFTTNQVYSVVNNPTSNYLWTVPTGATIISGQGTNSISVNWGNETTSGFVSVTEVSFCGNGALALLNVVVMPIPAAPVITGIDSVCPGQAAVVYSVTQSANSTYNWSVTNGTIVSGNGTSSVTVNWYAHGSGSVTVNQNNSCGVTSPDIQTVLIHSIKVGAPSKRVICPGEEVSLYVTGTSTNYSWIPSTTLDNALSSNPIASPSTTTIYTAFPLNACLISDTVTVFVKPMPQPNFNTELAENEVFSSVQFLNTTPKADSYLWNMNGVTFTDVEDVSYVFSDTGWVNVVLTASLKGCIDSITKPIYIKEIKVVYIPNTFSPNQDIINDYFQVIAKGYKKMDVFIFDRWGLMIKEMHNFNEGWDGTRNGKDVPIDVYEYKVVLYESLTSDDGKRTMYGTINLIR